MRYLTELAVLPAYFGVNLGRTVAWEVVPATRARGCDPRGVTVPDPADDGCIVQDRIIGSDETDLEVAFHRDHIGRERNKSIGSMGVWYEYS